MFTAEYRLAILDYLASRMIDGSISCKAAFDAAAALSITPCEVGTAIDFQNGRIVGCQLGLFGYGKVKAICKNGSPLPQGLSTVISSLLRIFL